MNMTEAAKGKLNFVNGLFNDQGNSDWLRQQEEENRLIGEITKHYNSSALEQRSSDIVEDSKKG
jgi:hypothetical protein